MEIQKEKNGGVLVLRCRGRLDGFGAGKLEEEANRALHDDDRSLVVDMEGVPYLSSAGIRVLLALQKKVKERGGKVFLASLPEFPWKVLDMAGFLTIFPHYGTVQEAVASAGRATERDLLLAELESPFIEKEGIRLSIEPGSPRTTDLRVQGNLSDVLYSRLGTENVSVIPFSGTEYALGLGALGMHPQDALPLLGEMVILHGTLVWLPTDGNDTPDFFTPLKDTGEVKIFSGYCVSLEGAFQEYLVMESATSGGVPLSMVYQVLFSYARERKKQIKGVAAVAMWAILGELESAGIIRSPLRENAPPGELSIMDPSLFDRWFEHGADPRYSGDTMVSFGIVLDTTEATKYFDAKTLGLIRYRHGSEGEPKGLFSHTHGVVFRNVPYDPSAPLDRQVKKILREGQFVDMRHLMDSTKIRKARIGIAYISLIKKDENQG
jgi:anti-anti-sigma factor